ncbi:MULTISPECIES: hypothetical protein [unclassified Modestobacter]|uniref:hypothetical protein n=1 Tax=unclassified Modestobacter TaxID=2643866 RepID=UPI0022AA9C1B|nr:MULTISPECIES: hypothetical protein [unclassified Modestobacter]MCZ2826015.1 hypothetical protein [Modestobacter sp. VKM Ac-2981]MCZ2852920.1 hypothetical protein [Modestobacter sp. VKM Ac-2982]
MITGVVVPLLLVGALLADLRSSGEPSPDADPIAAAAPAESAVPETAESTPQPPGFGDGTYLVGTDISPGRYRADGARSCSWQRLSDLTGDYDAVLAWEFPDGQAYVDVLPTDVAFATDDCGRWTPATGDVPDVSGAFDDGAYLVGSDIQPGTYRALGGSGCSWQRLSDLTGDYDAVLAWEFPDGQAYVDVLPTDVAFATDDCGTWNRTG